MSRPSEPLLKWIRAQLDARGQNTASLAAALGRPRGEVRRVLTGAVPMTVDELLTISEALDLSAEDMGLATPAAEQAADFLDAVEEGQHWGNQPEALFRLGFDVGIDFTIFVDTEQLDGWGGPNDVRDGYVGKEMPIRLDAAYHSYMEPVFDAHGATLTLSFDKLYRCTFPWSAVQRVLFVPFLPEPDDADDITADQSVPDGGPPKLRLVT